MGYFLGQLGSMRFAQKQALTIESYNMRKYHHTSNIIVPPLGDYKHIYRYNTAPRVG